MLLLFTVWVVSPSSLQSYKHKDEIDNHEQKKKKYAKLKKIYQDIKKYKWSQSVNSSYKNNDVCIPMSKYIENWEDDLQEICGVNLLFTSDKDVKAQVKKMKKQVKQTSWYMCMAKTRIIFYLFSIVSSLIFGYYVLMLSVFLPYVENEFSILYDYSNFIAMRLLFGSNIIIGMYSLIDNSLNFDLKSLNLVISNTMEMIMMGVNCYNMVIFDSYYHDIFSICYHSIILITYICMLLLGLRDIDWKNSLTKFAFANKSELALREHTEQMIGVDGRNNINLDGKKEMWQRVNATLIGNKNIGKTSILRSLMTEKLSWVRGILGGILRVVFDLIGGG